MAETHDITIDQGSLFLTVVTYADDDDNPINLTGYTARMQIRANHSAPTAMIDLTPGQGLTLGGQAGTIVIRIGAITSATLPAGSHRYDLELTPGGVADNTFRLLEGSVDIRPEVTR